MPKYNISHLAQFGDQYPLELGLDTEEIQKDLEDFSDKWSPYNPRKSWINREGLCILNERGECGPGPALDSLGEYNLENGTNYTELDFNKPTEFYHHSKALQDMMKDMLPWCIRSHFLRLGPGGYFPPHRDHVLGEQQTFRLIVPIQNNNPPHSRFMIEDRSLYWDGGVMYYVNTTKQHSLFNAFPRDSSIWLVINAVITDESVEYVSRHMSDR